MSETWPLDEELVQARSSPGRDSIAYSRWLDSVVSSRVVRSDGSGSKTLAINASDPASKPLSPIASTGDGGWSRQNPLLQRGSLSAVAFTDATHGWAVGDSGTILTTTRRGTTWKKQGSGSEA